MTIWKSELLNRQDWLVHGTATLAFGSTRYPNAGEDDKNVESRAKFLRELGLGSSRLVASENVHGRNVAVVEDHPQPLLERRRGDVEKIFEINRVADCDGLVTSIPNLPLAIKTADCLPIFIADPTTRTVAIVHAGWKGVMAGIAIEAVRVLVDRGSSVRDIVVAIGPSIGPCHYVIHDERRDEMMAKTPFVSEVDFTGTLVPSGRDALRVSPNATKVAGKSHRVDLRAIVVRQLVSSGVLETNVDASAPCTACHPEKFASYFLSRDMTRGMLSAISIRPSVD